MKFKTIIIGAGPAGLSCAYQLVNKSIRDFAIIAKDIGGRVKYLPDKKVNMGAYFVMKNYMYAKKIFKREKWINPLKIYFIDDNDKFKTVSVKSLKLIPQLVKFLSIMIRFSYHYKRFKKRCATNEYMEILQKDAFLYELSNTKALELMQRKKLKELSDAIISKFVYACTLTDISYLSAFDMMVICQGLFQPIYTFSFDNNRVRKDFGNNLILDTVISISEMDSGFLIKTESGEEYICESCVVATPASVTKQLLHLDKIRNNSSAYVFYIKGNLKSWLNNEGLNLFSPLFDVSTIVKEKDAYLVFSPIRKPDFSKYFTYWDIIEEAQWNMGLYVKDNYLLHQYLGNNCYIAGDHNACGLEPACISGVYAANKILQRIYKIKPSGKLIRRIFKTLVILAIAFVFLYKPVIAPYILTKGATKNEVAMYLPGDEVIPHPPKINMTQAVTVHASKNDVWKWLVQIGQDRAGFYSYETLERLFGFGIHNSYEIREEWQKIKPGDFIRFHKNGIGMFVYSVKEGEYFVLLTDYRKPQGNNENKEFRLPLPKDMFLVWNWSFNCIELPDNKTRLIIRCLVYWPDTNIVLDWVLHFFSEITGCIMNWEMINELKQCAEGYKDDIKIHFILF